MADQILFNVAADIITNLGSYAVQQIGLALGAEKELRKLEITMSTLKNVLLDAEEQQVTNRAVREWLQRLKEIVYEVDNLVDEFAYEALRRQVEIHGSKRREVRNFFSHTNPFVFGYNMGQKTKDVRERLDEIVADAKNFDFAIKVVEKHVQSRRRQETYSFVRSTEVVGRESDQEAIIQTLKSSSDEQSVHVIPIFGMGGLGKTTLAQSVYNDNWVANQFSQRIWVHVSEDFDIRGIVIKILNAVGDNECDKLAFQQLQNRLQQKLSERKFLLVLDDVWNEDRVEWIKLHDLLMAGVGGSMIIVTTRSNKVASIMGTCTPHILKGLSNDDCLSIFVRWAFNEGDDRKHQNLVNIGREIVRKCGGVPLAARTLGGLLYLKFDVHDWMLVRDSKIWAIVQNENDIMPVLRLSYDQMPSYLKQCFAYCSLFQKNEKIEKWRLIYLWMAQGFIQVSHHNEKLEDIGESYITELVNRSFLQEERQLGYYKMHDLVHDLAQYVSSGECFTINSTTEPNPERLRHAVLWLSLKDLEILKSMNLRTILRSGRSCSRYVQTIVSSFRYLRVLELNCFTGDVPSSIGELKHLRYLLIKADYGKITLPESISQLLNLQYLNLCTQWQHFFELPQGVGKLINLRCLSLNNIPLVGLPDEIGGLTILQRLRISGTKLKSLPEGIQHLSCLRYLEISRCNGLTSLLSGMQYLTSLEELIIRECCYLNFTKNDFQGLISLRSLTLYYLPKLISFPQRLQQSAATLEHIRIVFCPFLSSLSNCLEYLTSLRKLELCFCPSVMELPEKTKRLTELTILDGRTDWNLIKYFLEPFEGKNVSSAVNGFFLEYFSRRNARDFNLKTKFFTRSAVTYNIE